MLDQFREFLQRFGAEFGADPSQDLDDPRVAAAALLFHVSGADGTVTGEEATRLREVLAGEYGVGAGEAHRLAEAGERADRESVDLYRFTSVLIAHTGETDRVRFVELLWELTYADGDLHEMEDNLIWRIAELLGVSARDRMSAKRDVRARLGLHD